MITLPYCAKQASAMAEFASDRAKAKLDAAIDAEADRDELISARTQEIAVKRLAELSPLDVQAGLQSILAGLAGMIGESLRKGDYDIVGVYIRSAVHLYIEQDSEILAIESIERIEREVSHWSN